MQVIVTTNMNMLIDNGDYIENTEEIEMDVENNQQNESSPMIVETYPTVMEKRIQSAKQNLIKNQTYRTLQILRKKIKTINPDHMRQKNLKVLSKINIDAKDIIKQLDSLTA